jgi:hypothetical protein
MLQWNISKKHADELLLEASDSYEDYITTDKKSREKLYQTPLIKNDTYIQPNKLSKKIERIEKIREKFSFLNQTDDPNNELSYQ